MRLSAFHVLLISLAIAPAAHAGDPAAAVREFLNAEVAAWNRCDLEGVMEGYWKSPELTFFTAGEVKKGWQQTYDRYVELYRKDGLEMGQLAFDELSFDPMSDDAVLVRGRWKLMRKSGGKNGLFTLIVARKPEGWRIVHDHTSAAEP
jgi:ketosteroid isomerase-like protein